jgi:hypothetical protein
MYVFQKGNQTSLPDTESVTPSQAPTQAPIKQSIREENQDPNLEPTRKVQLTTSDGEVFDIVIPESMATPNADLIREYVK